MNNKIQEAVRVVGYLLETNGTIDQFARRKDGRAVNVTSPLACRFCLQGAVNVVTNRILKSDHYYDLKLDDAVAAVLGIGRMEFTVFWDDANRADKKAIVERLKKA